MEPARQSFVALPVVGQVIEASKERPYLCLRLDLEPAMLSALILEVDAGEAFRQTPGPGLSLSETTAELLDASIRFVSLLDAPQDIAFLAPLAEREILYRLLKGEQASRLRQIAHAKSKLTQINREIDVIKRHFRKPLKIDELAAKKRLRLQEARRLILASRSTLPQLATMSSMPAHRNSPASMHACSAPLPCAIPRG